MQRISDSAAFSLIAALSLGVLAFLGWLLYIHVPEGAAVPAWVASLPGLNAVFNSSSGCCLLIGLGCILSGRRDWHQRFMLSALTFTTFFLVSYVTYHHFHGDTKFLGQGWIRPLYFFILITHILASGITLPLALTLLFFAFTARFEKHKKIARITYPIWLYVCVTGVAIYFFLKPYYLN
jgi:putative membrane protein